MNTRFDGTHWINAAGVSSAVSELSTAHALNTLKMLVQHPDRTLAMLLDDLESGTYDTSPWSPAKNEIKIQSIRNATSMSTLELKEYALNSVLGKALATELEKRGVNVENITNIYAACAAD